MKKDEERWIYSWFSKYWPEIAKRNNVRKMDIQLIYGAKIKTNDDNKNFDPYCLEVIKELKKYEVEQKKQPAEVAREIYNNKGELDLVDIISRLITYYIAGKLQKRYEINNFEWCLDFLEESFKILGAEEAVYWVKKDEERWIYSWLSKYWPEIAKRNNLPPVNLYGYKIEKLDDDTD